MTMVERGIELRTASGCGLAIGRYPRFSYDASGGGGSCAATPVEQDGRLALAFAPDSLHIPPMDRHSTRCLGLPLPPGLSIAIHPEQLGGWLQPQSGTVALRLDARFRFRVGRLYTAPDLLISTTLTTGESRGALLAATGLPLGPSGAGLLVGVAVVQPSGDGWLDRFLGLPTEALALLRCRFIRLPC